MRCPLNQLMAAALLAVAVGAAASAQGTMAMFQRPLGLGALRGELNECSPLTPSQWALVIDAHEAYLQQVRRLRESEIDALMHRMYGNRSTAERALDEQERFRLWVKLDAADRTLFDQLQLVLGDDAAGVIKSARRTRERRNLLQICSPWYLPDSADCIESLMNLKLEGPERQAALEVAAPVEERIVAALRQMIDATMNLTKRMQQEMAAAGVPDNWWENMEAMSPEDRQSMSERGQQAWRRAYDQIMSTVELVLKEERGGLRRLVQCLSPNPAAKLQKLYYSRAYPEMGDVFAAELERQARQVLRSRSLDQLQATAVRDAFSAWLAAEGKRVEEAADLIDGHRLASRLRTDWDQQAETVFNERLQKLAEERVDAAKRVHAAILAIAGPERAAAVGAAADSPELRPLDEVVLVGLDEVDPYAGLADGPAGEPARDRTDWSVSFTDGWGPMAAPSRESLASMTQFLGLSEAESGIVAILLEDAEHAEAGASEAWQQANGGLIPSPEEQVGNPDQAQTEADQEALAKRVLIQRSELREAATQRESALWDDVAALLPDHERWRVEFVRLARASNQRRQLPLLNAANTRLVRVWPDLAAGVGTLPLSAEQQRAFCQAAVAAASAAPAAGAELDRAWDQSQIGDHIAYRRVPDGNEEVSAEFWQRHAEERAQRMERNQQKFAALRTLVEAAAESAANAAAEAGASREQVAAALRRSSYIGVWEEALDPGLFISRACADEVLRASDPDSAADPTAICARLEPIRASWIAGHDPCCESLAQIADQLAVVLPEQQDREQDMAKIAARVFLEIAPISLRFYRDECSLRAMERIAGVLGEERCAALAGFDAARQTLRKRSAIRSDWN